jgi:DNA processing protein
MCALPPWFALKCVPGVGNLLFRRLVEQFGSPEAVFEADRTALLAVKGVTARLISAIRRHQNSDAGKRELEAVRRNGYTIVTQADRRFPRYCARFQIHRHFYMFTGRCRPPA